MPLVKLLHHLDQEQYTPAKREAERLLLRSDFTPQQQAQLYRAACRICLGTGEYYAAVKFGELAVQTAAVKNPGLLALAHFDLGCAHSRVGNTTDAVEQFDKFFALVEKSHWQSLEPRALFNMGILYRRMRRYDDAMEVYRQAAVRFADVGQGERGIQAWQNAAWCQLLQGHPGAAEPLMGRAEAYLAQHTSPMVEAEHLCQVGLQHRLFGDLAGSTEACQKVFAKFAGQDALRPYVGQAAWVVAENALDAGRVAEARIFGAIAMEAAETCKWPDLVNLVSQLVYRLDKAGKQSKAS